MSARPRIKTATKVAFDVIRFSAAGGEPDRLKIRDSRLFQQIIVGNYPTPLPEILVTMDGVETASIPSRFREVGLTQATTYER